MKKLLSLLLVAILLIGCSSSNATQISTKDEVLFKIEDRTVTRGDIYNMIRFQSNTSKVVISEAQQALINAKVEETDEIVQTAQENLKNAKEQLGDFFAYRYGTATDEELIEDMFIPAAKQEVFIRQYFTENQDKIIAQDKPVKVHVLYFDTQENAQQALDKLNTDTMISDIISQLGSQTKTALNKLEPSVVAKTSLPAVVAQFVDSDEGQGLKWSKAVLSDTEGFYLARVENADSASLTEEYVDAFMTNQQSLSDLMAKVFKEANFEVYDQAIYDAIKSNEQLSDYTPDN